MQLVIGSNIMHPIHDVVMPIGLLHVNYNSMNNLYIAVHWFILA